MDPYPLDPLCGRLGGSGSVWRDTDPGPGHINVQNNARQKSFFVLKAKHGTKKYESILISLELEQDPNGEFW